MDRSHRHRQQPLVSLVPVPGEGRSVSDLDEECRAALLAVAERQSAALAGSTSQWLPFLGVILEECAEPVETGASIRVV